MPYLTRDQILEVQDLQYEDVAVPEWGGTVRVRGLTGTERDAFEASVVQQQGKKTSYNLTNLRARLVSLSVVDEAGKRLFSDRDVQALGRKSAAALARVYEVASRLSGISDSDMEELAKNSESGQSDDSGSD